jgi:hypothetical protein
MVCLLKEQPQNSGGLSQLGSLAFGLVEDCERVIPAGDWRPVLNNLEFLEAKSAEAAANFPLAISPQKPTESGKRSKEATIDLTSLRLAQLARADMHEEAELRQKIIRTLKSLVADRI